MPGRKDWTGQRFGRLVAVSFVGEKAAFWGQRQVQIAIEKLITAATSVSGEGGWLDVF